MERINLLQTLFLGFLVATFFVIFNSLSDFFSYSFDLISPGFGMVFGRVLFILILISIALFILGYHPEIIDLEDKWLIKHFRRIAWIVSAIVVCMIFEAWFIAALKQGSMRI